MLCLLGFARPTCFRTRFLIHSESEASIQKENEGDEARGCGGYASKGAGGRAGRQAGRQAGKANRRTILLLGQGEFDDHARWVKEDCKS